MTSGLDPIEQALLGAMLEAGARHDTSHRKCARVVLDVCDATGLAPGDVYRRLTDLASPWLTGLRLVDPHGNMGARSFPPAGPRYTEVRLTQLGAACAEADVGTGPPIPAGLVHGDTFKGGTRPPLDPRRLITGLRLLADGADEASVLAAIGLPAFPADCLIDVALPDVYVGGTDATLTGHINVEADRVSITSLPPGISESEVCAQLASRRFRPPSEGMPEELTVQIQRHHLPLDDVRDMSVQGQLRIELLPRRGNTPAELAARLPEIYGVRIHMALGYPRPLVDELRTWMVHPAALEGLDRLEALLP